MAGFRNVLAHEYAEIDNERLYEHLRDIEHFRTYAVEVAEFAGLDER